jgi:hypothetical protein
MNKMKMFSQAQTSGLSNYANVQTGIRQLGAMSEGNRATAAANLLTLNAALMGSASYQVNEKLVNQILLQTVAVGNLNFTEMQLMSLGNIAALCPLSDGEAVLKARAMLQLVQGSPLNFNDAANCVGGERSEQYQIIQSIRVYPNPTNSLVTIEYQALNNENIQFLLFNTLGQVVRSVTLPQGQTSIQLSVSDLSEGVYWYSCSGLLNTSGKLVISR